MTVWVYRGSADYVEEVTCTEVDPELWASEWCEYFTGDVYFLADLVCV